MKPPQFDYFGPTELSDVLSLLAGRDRGMRILAGGQSLLPLLSSRRLRPHALIDINNVSELNHLSWDSDGLKVGATIRQRELERHPGLAEVNPLLAETLPLIGHIQTRNRGTICGSLAHADPAAELPAVAITQEAKFTIQSKGARRTVEAQKFFKDPFTTIMEPDEMLTDITFPTWNTRAGWAIEQVSRRPGNFAMAGVMVLFSPANGSGARVRITVFGNGDIPRRSESAEELVSSDSLSSALLDEMVNRVRAEVSTRGETDATSEYLRHVTGPLARRALIRAAQRAGVLTEGFNG
jgi:carbon-monoxide dehydrogenase medium subunit